MVVTDTGQPTSAAASAMATPTNNPLEMQKHIGGQPGLQDTPEMRALQESTTQTDLTAAGGINVSHPPEKQLHHTSYPNFTPPSQNYAVYNQANIQAPHDAGSIPPTPGNQQNVITKEPQLQQNNGGSSQSESKQETKKGGSCCCHKSEKSDDTSIPNQPTKPKDEHQGSSYPSHLNPGPYGPFEGHALGWKQEGVSSPGNPAPVQHYPLNTVRNPNQRIMSNFQISQPASAPPPATYTLPNNGHSLDHFGQNPSGHYIPSGLSEHRLGAPSIFSYDPAHNCNCGDGCQCLGCASHPFNNTTKQHIQEMGYLMTMDGDDVNSERSRSRGHTLYDEQMSPKPAQYPAFPNNGLDFAQAPQGEPLGTFSGPMTAPGFEHGPTNPGSVSYGSGYNQMMMQPSAYYTVEYPVGDLSPCTDMTGTCQCGSDCSCVGCLTHSGHNGLSLGSPQQPNPPNLHTTPGFSPQSGLPYTQPPEHMSPLDYTSNSPESQRPVDPNPV